MLEVHPGEILREEFLKPLNMTPHALALGVPFTRISGIVRERRAITADTAARLGRYFGMTPQFWMNLQTHYDLAVIESQKAKELDHIIPLPMRAFPA